MERRLSEREAVNLPTTLIVQGEQFPNCHILNYSTGGLYLEGEEFNTVASQVLKNPNSRVGIPGMIIYSPQDGQNSANIKFPVRVIFTSERGAGIAFIKPETEMLSILANSRSSSKIADPSSHSNQSTLIQTVADKIQTQLLSYIKSQFPEFIEQAKKLLLETADSATHNQEQSDMFYGLSILESSAEDIHRSLVSELDEQLKQFSNIQEKSIDPSSRTTELSLVERDAFEEWVAIISTARAVQDSAIQDDLEARLSKITGRVINEELNPISTYSLLKSIDAALGTFQIGSVAKHVIYQACQNNILGSCHTLHKDINCYLASKGISGIDHSTFIQLDHADKDPDLITQPSAKRSKRTLMGRVSALLSRPSVKSASKDRQAIAGSGQVISSLDSIHGLSGIPVSQAIETQLNRSAFPSDKSLVLDSATRNKVDSTAEIISSIQMVNPQPDIMHDLLSDLKVPIIKQALSQKIPLEDSDHPSNKLLSSLDEISRYNPTLNDPQAEQRLLSELSQIINKPNSSLEEMTEQLNLLVNRNKATFQTNISTVEQSSREYHHQIQAQQALFEMLSKRMLGKSVATVVLELFTSGWAGLLCSVYPQNKEESTQFDAYLQIIDHLLHFFPDTGKSVLFDHDQRQLLIDTLQEGAASYPPLQTASEDVINAIKEALLSGGEAYTRLNQKRETVEKTFLIQLLPDAHRERPKESLSEETLQWEELVNNLKVGDWIVEKHQLGQMRLLNLAWKGSAPDRFVFVDGKGQKMIDTPLMPLIESFNQSSLSLLEDGELPLVERAVNQVLKKTYNQLKLESNQDVLTGLMNRRALTSKLKKAIESSNNDGDHHILILLDIDQFSLINDLCGELGGDQLLKSVANICRSYLPSSATIARTGDDEFCLLVENCTRDEGFRIAESQRRAVENLQFEWQGQYHPVTASVGMASIQKNSLSTTALFRAVNAACALAKGEERNCTRIYRQSQEVYEKRERLIQSLPVIEEALEKNSITLFAQPISPLFIGDNELEHHEILLRVLDEKGNTFSPEEFIAAAEQYDRIRAVDRWVVNRFFNWLGSQPDAANIGGGFSINLSGHSLIDESFIQLLMEKVNNAPLPADRIAFEITETVLISNTTRVRNLMQRLREMGCKFFLDDFGSGYASYSYLKDFPVDTVKIDGVFVRDMLEDKSSFAMVRSITEISHHMGKKVIAEYAESEAILIALRQLEVDFAQGYGIGRPVPLEQLAAPMSAA